MSTSIEEFKITPERQKEIEQFLNDHIKGKDHVDVAECIRAISKKFTGNTMKIAIWGIAFKLGIMTANAVFAKQAPIPITENLEGLK